MPLFIPHSDLQQFNTLAVPAIASYFVSVKDDEGLLAAIEFAKSKNIPLMILGGGSNIVLRADFPGLVIHMQAKGVTVVAESDNAVWLKVAAGEIWHELVEYTLNNGFFGLENLSLIPGTVGAAPIQNIGAYGVELKDVFYELAAIEITSGMQVTFTKESCQFGYRDSIFKQALKDRYVITSVTFELSKVPAVNIRYPALQSIFKDGYADTVSPQDISAAVISIRQSKLPDPAKLPNVGSFFKNPIISEKKLVSIKNAFPDVVSYPAGAGSVKLAAAWLIDQAGWRGVNEDGVGVHQHQALVLVNPAKRSGGNVLALADKIIRSVNEKFGVELEMEPRVYP